VEGFVSVGEQDELNVLMNNRRNVAPGEVIFLEGQPGDCAYIVLKGEVQVAVNDAKGNLVVLKHMLVGEMFGELAILKENCLRTATAMSKEGGELLIIDKSVFTRRLSEADPFLRFVIEHLCQRVLLWTDRVRAT